MSKLKQYSPWFVSLLLAALCALLGFGSPDPAAPSEPTIVTVRDTVRDTVWSEVRVPVRYAVIVRDTMDRDPALIAGDGEALRGLAAERDSLNREILRFGETLADIDTTITIPIGDSSHVTLEARIEHEVERGYTTLALRVKEAVLSLAAECPGNTWGWISAAGAAIAAVLAVIIK
jgi:hypothetical protein